MEVMTTAISRVVDQQPIPFLAVPQGLLGALALRDVVNDGIEKPPALEEDRDRC